MAKSSNNDPAPALEDLSFEAALERLESIVEAMESGDLPLEKLLAEYEQGMKLASVCARKLAEAELKVQQLEKTSEGQFRLKPLTAEETPEG
ncbi:MAG: exodeoxyribonuclease VII small subunit [Limisphaera sp.]|jgi:exodeoxyribonuclease VII small subunit|nr:exodeoxyribonuclease VII small subunit [Limisphaera sp.]